MNPADKIFWTITMSQLLFYFFWVMAKDIAKSDRDDEDLTMTCHAKSSAAVELLYLNLNSVWIT